MVKVKRKVNILFWVAVGVIFLVGITFASIFSTHKTIDIPVYPSSLTTNIIMKEDLSDVVDGETVITSASFKSGSTTNNVYVRADIRYYVDSIMTNSDRIFLICMNYTDVATSTGDDYKWVRSEDGFYYLTNTSGVPIQINKNDATEYMLCENVIYAGSKNIVSGSTAPTNLKLRVSMQAVNAKNMETNTALETVADKFKECFGNNYTLGYIVTFDTDNAGVCPAQVFLDADSTAVRPESPSKIGYFFQGWFIDSEFSTEYDFNSKVTSSFTLYAKFVKGQKVTVTKDSNITSVSITTASGENVLNCNIVPLNEKLTIAVTPASGYKANWTVTNNNIEIIGNPTSVTVEGAIIITITSAEMTQGTLSSSCWSTMGITDKSTVGSITFYDGVMSIPSTVSSTTEYDLTDSATTSTGKVLGYKIANTKNSSLYDLYIASDGVIKLPKDCSSLFADMTKLTTINNFDIVDGGDVTETSRMFSDCSSLTGSITIPDSVTYIGYGAFYNCSSLTSITIPDSVISIGGSAFYSCSSLTSITIPDSVTSIGDNAFTSCSSLTSITIPDSVTSIGYNAFNMCTDLQNTVGDLIYIKTTTNPYYYLQDTTNTTLTSVSINENCKFIGSSAFSSCSSLTSITIPDSVTRIGVYAFSGCDSLTSVTYTKEVEGKYRFVNGTLTILDGGMTDSPQWEEDNINELIFEVVFNGNEASIGSFAFYGCSRLTSITIPNSVTSIGSSAFYGCMRLTSVTFGEDSQLISIGKNAFFNCSSLTSITIPSGVTSIGSMAFYWCTNLTSVTFEDPEGWFVADSSTATSGTDVTLTDTTQNATYLKDTYRNQYWIKKKSA